MCFVESAIIFETQNEYRFEAIIVATCNRDEQFRRLRESRGQSDEQILARLDLQLPSEEKERRADYVIHTDCTLPELEQRVTTLYHTLTQQHREVSL